MSKKYGLILPKSKTALASKKLAPKPNVFGDDSDSGDDDDEASKKKEVNAEIHRVAMKNIMRKQTKLEMQKALEEDPTVYDYDEIYDEMKEKSKAKIPDNVAKADKKREPKYIKNILKATQLRKLEQERREERIIQREREKEGDEFIDKDQFVTSAYKEKLRQQEILKEEERRQDAIENALDVRKQRDLSGFYRHFLNQQTGEEPTKSNIKEENENLEKPPDKNLDEDSNLSSEDEQSTSSSSGSSGSTQSEEETKYEQKNNNNIQHQDRSQERHSRNKKGRRLTNEAVCERDKDSEKYRKSHKREDFKRKSRHKHHEDSYEKNRHSHRDRQHRDSNSRERKSRSDYLDEDSRDSTNRHRKESSRHSPDKFSLNIERKLEKNKSDDKKTEDKQPSKYQKHATNDSIMSAKERYLARKQALKTKPVIASDSE